VFFTCRGRAVEEELTYDKFADGLKNNMEYTFYCNDMTIDFAYHYENGSKIWELNINGDDADGEHQYFNSAEDLINNARISGKAISEIWESLYN